MNNNCIIHKIIWTILIVSCIAPLHSCKKEATLKSATSYSILGRNFDNYTSMFAALDTVLSFEIIEKLSDYEDCHHYKSLGRVSDIFYEESFTDVLNDFNSNSELLNFCNSNNTLIAIEYEDGETEQTISPIFSNNPYRYFANEQGVFYVGQDIVKVFPDFTIAVSNTDASILLNITNDSDINPSDTSNNIKWLFWRETVDVDEDGNEIDHEHCVTKGHYTRYYYSPSSSNERMKVVSEYQLRSSPAIGLPYSWYFLTQFKYQKKYLGCWVKQKANLSMTITGQYHGIPNDQNYPNNCVWSSHNIYHTKSQTNKKLNFDQFIYSGHTNQLKRRRNLVNHFSHVSSFTITTQSPIGTQTFTL